MSRLPVSGVAFSQSRTSRGISATYTGETTTQGFSERSALWSFARNFSSRFTASSPMRSAMRLAAKAQLPVAEKYKIMG